MSVKSTAECISAPEVAGTKLEWLEVMRAAAACWVLLHHGKQATDAFIGPMDIAGGGMIANGYLGVDFFFILSGFIIAHSSNRLLKKGQGLGDYARARLIRIYIPYLPIGIGMLLAYKLLPGISASDRPVGVLTSLTLLPSNLPPALSVAWTLVHEMMFYVLFSLFFLSRRLLLLALGLWSAAIAIAYMQDLPLAREGWGYLLSPLNLCFLLGVSLYYATRQGVARSIAAGCLVIGLATLLVQSAQEVPDRWLVAVAFACLIACGVSAAARALRPWRLLMLGGAASYAIYLIHGPVLSLAVRIVGRLTPDLAPLPAFVLVSALALCAGLAYHIIYERQALQLAKKVIAARGLRLTDKEHARPN